LAFFEPLVAIRASEPGVGRALKRNLVMAVTAGRRNGSALVPERGGERQPCRKSHGREKSRDPPVRTGFFRPCGSKAHGLGPFQKVWKGTYLPGTGCLIFSQKEAKSKLMPWGFSWHFRHWALMASGLP